MKTVELLSWNVNGIRAIHRKGFLDWFARSQPDILCLQETKARQEQLPEELRKIAGYGVYYVAAQKKGYSGVGLFTRLEPERLLEGLGRRKYDVEGRVIIADYGAFLLFNVYFPNGKMSKDRLRYKMAFYDEFLSYVNRLRRRGKKMIVCLSHNL